MKQQNKIVVGFAFVPIYTRMAESNGHKIHKIGWNINTMAYVERYRGRRNACDRKKSLKILVEIIT